ncbi:MAG TPA: hypothetical protein VEP90_15100, partial [Methylomirabilota bacterium]|nr:hypothetical protein [Methylomirabilota bacterium]
RPLATVSSAGWAGGYRAIVGGTQASRVRNTRRPVRNIGNIKKMQSILKSLFQLVTKHQN